MSASEVPANKVCPDCGEHKATTEFGRNASRADGLAAYCKPCFRERANQHYRKKRAASGQPVRERVLVEGHRLCASCQELKPEAEFHKARSKASGLNCYCKTCRAAYAAALHLRRSYGLDAEAVAQMVEAQGHTCAVCGERTAEHVDHDHITGAVRGVLCRRCNLAIGQFEDRVQLLEAAIGYLEATTWQKRRVAPGVYAMVAPTRG